ncbi:protein serine/threonine phosphatase 2C [Mycena galericulata]|nr:protein serine/threonine phosphatase 2C [Mycena galericulata]
MNVAEGFWIHALPALPLTEPIPFPFSPPTQSRISEDRIAIEQWQIQGRRWTFLAVFDGHGGVNTAEYAVKTLSSSIRTALTVLLQEPGADTNTATQRVSDMLLHEIKRFDHGIGKAVRNLCKSPDALDDVAAQAIVAANFEVLARAHYGSTLAAALLNESATQLWVASVGDSTVGISYIFPDGTRDGKRLSTRHHVSVPTEYARISVRHPTSENGDLFTDDRVLGLISMTRALGDFSLKLPTAFSEKLFFKLPNTFSPDYVERVTKFNKTPPYLTATPTVDYFDLTSFDPLAKEPILMLFSDGVDNIVNGEWVFHQDSPPNDEPAAVVGALLGDKVPPEMETIVGHPVELGWLGEGRNMATEVLGNLLAGTEARKFTDAMDPVLLADPDKLYIDDVTLILLPMRTLPVNPPHL